MKTFTRNIASIAMTLAARDLTMWCRSKNSARIANRVDAFTEELARELNKVGTAS